MKAGKVPQLDEYVKRVCPDAHNREQHVLNRRRKLRAVAKKLAQRKNQQTQTEPPSKNAPNAFSLLNQARSNFFSHMKLSSPNGARFRGAHTGPRFIGH